LRGIINSFVKFFIEILDAYITDVSQSTTHISFLFNASQALDKDLDTFQHFNDKVPSDSNWWKVKFNVMVFIHKVRIVNRIQCCQERSNNIDIITTLVARGQRHDTVCANTGILEAEKTLDCSRFANEMKIVGSTRFNLAEIYIFGKVY